eukprot:1179992-Ditylum_brightwellii.AAC.1
MLLSSEELTDAFDLSAYVKLSVERVQQQMHLIAPTIPSEVLTAVATTVSILEMGMVLKHQAEVTMSSEMCSSSMVQKDKSNYPKAVKADDAAAKEKL